MNKVVKAGMWDAVKDDGRLGYRGCPGVATHVTAVVRISFPVLHLVSNLDAFLESYLG